MANKTYDEWKAEAKESGYYDTFSDRDLEHIKQDTSWGDTLLTGKKEYDAAGSPEEKAAIADKYNTMRTDRGYYNTVEGDGKGGYRAISHTVESDAGKAYDDSLPGNKSPKYVTMIDSLLKQIAGDKFSYDAKSDPRYALAEEYADQAMKNQMAESAILSGGYGNSYASAAGQQVYTDYMNNAVGDMEDRAYQRWAAERDNNYNLLSIASQLEQQEYERAIYDQEWKHMLEREGVEDARYENTTNYNRQLDSISLAIQTGNYDKLSEYGFDPSYLESIRDDEVAQKELKNAISLANIGIYEPLEAIGYDTTWLRGQQGDASTPKLDLNTALSLKEAGYSSSGIDAALSYWLGEGYTYTAPATPTTNNTPVVNEDKSIPIDYKTATKYAIDVGGISAEIVARMMTPAEFSRRNPGKYYGDYVSDFVEKYGTKK